MEEKKPKKKRPFRRAYLEDFHRNVAGEYIYTGPTHTWVSPRGKSLAKLWLCGIGGLVAALAAGCIPDCRMEQRPWALIPYVLALLFAGIQIWKLYRLTDGGDPVRDYVWKASVKPLPVLGILTAALAGIAAAAELVNLLLPGFDGKILAAILYILLELLVLVTALFLRRWVLRLKWS